MELSVEQIREYRKVMGWTQGRAAELAGVHVQTVKKWERAGIDENEVKKALYVSAMVMRQQIERD
jgi:DNA-binding XRE family transcriptional regulator